MKYTGCFSRMEIENLKKEFDKLRSESRYSELGWWFWKHFLLSNKKQKKQVKKLWDSLSRNEKDSCEQC